jgi:hypothetical protein
MKERSDLVEWIRAEIVGPSRSSEPTLIKFAEKTFSDPIPLRRGPLAWRAPDDTTPQEVLYYERESPHRKYGAGLLHPIWASSAQPPSGDAANQSADTLGVDADLADEDDESPDEGAMESGADDLINDASDDFEVTSPDIRHPTTMGISFCAKIDRSGKLIVAVPLERRFAWQMSDAPPVQLNGRYESCHREWINKDGRDMEGPAWRRRSATSANAAVVFEASEFSSHQVIRRELVMPSGSPIRLSIEVFPRRLKNAEDLWIITVVMRNATPLGAANEREAVLYQSFFQVSLAGGTVKSYPEGVRAFDQLDMDEQSLALLYRDEVTWAIGHGCAAGWEGEGTDAPTCLFADTMPVVELPSMTPNVEVDGREISLSMAELSELPDEPGGSAWDSLESLADAYASWIGGRRSAASGLPLRFDSVAKSHLDRCEECLQRIRRGIELLKTDANVRTSFRLANRAMLLQQIATKKLDKRPLGWNADARLVLPKGPHASPASRLGGPMEGLGTWRAFQAAFLLMSLDDTHRPDAKWRETVDLIWFPTGGGKTEAYLALAAFYMFHERLIPPLGELRRDGTNVLMRYTLRMLTTQQFQRAASLICAMEHLRRHQSQPKISGGRFSLGLWIGQQGSPNNIDGARQMVGEFRRGSSDANPLVLTDCPWCRAEIGRYSGPKPQSIRKSDWNGFATCGVTDHKIEGPLLHCSDPQCEFGGEDATTWLPIEVIDERIYARPPSLVIATVDKFAMVAYRPLAGALFGRRPIGGKPQQVCVSPGLIIQDELHLISGPLGSLYAIYEGVFERLCSIGRGDKTVRPKIIASTATIRGADEQVRTLYARSKTALFPSPGLAMGDSFFGRYARFPDGSLRPGRMYVGVHASDYGSVLTTQVRAFSAALFRPWGFPAENRDAWWTLLAFYNSIRELGGAKTLFDSDIRSRLKFMFNREGYPQEDRRTLKVVEELTSRLTQSDIVKMMDRLSTTYSPKASGWLDACLASNIIEVGVDIARLSLMGVVGQPKTTSTYIQVTGRVGRRWMERPGLILMIYNPSKSRDRSHYEQFHGYHRRLYERVEPTTATPFAISAIQRALAGALLVWARQQSTAPVQGHSAYVTAIEEAAQILTDRCSLVQIEADEARSLAELRRVTDELLAKWRLNPQHWEEFPPRVDGEYLMLWPGQFSTPLQRDRGVAVPSSMRQVDGSAELTITQGYIADQLAQANAAQMPVAGGPQPGGGEN